MTIVEVGNVPWGPSQAETPKNVGILVAHEATGPEQPGAGVRQAFTLLGLQTHCDVPHRGRAMPPRRLSRSEAIRPTTRLPVRNGRRVT